MKLSINAQATIMTLAAFFMEVSIMGLVFGAILYTIGYASSIDMGAIKAFIYGMNSFILIHGLKLYMNDLYRGFYNELED